MNTSFAPALAGAAFTRSWGLCAPALWLHRFPGKDTEFLEFLSAGLIGSLASHVVRSIVVALLESRACSRIFCLVRAADAAAAQGRLLKAWGWGRRLETGNVKRGVRRSLVVVLFFLVILMSSVFLCVLPLSLFASSRHLFVRSLFHVLVHSVSFPSFLPSPLLSSLPLSSFFLELRFFSLFWGVRHLSAFSMSGSQWDCLELH